MIYITSLEKFPDLSVLETPRGWVIFDEERSIKVFFAKNIYNLCYALKGREIIDLIVEYNQFIREMKIPHDKVAWFYPDDKDQSITKISYPIREINTYEGVIKSRYHELIEKENTNILWTEEKGITLGIHTADCVPLVLTSKGKVCICHLYWWHAINGFFQKIIDTLKENGFSDMQAIIGPFYREPITRNIFDVGERTFKIGDPIYEVLSKNEIQYFDIEVDTFKNLELWSYIQDSKNSGNQAAFVQMI